MHLNSSIPHTKTQLNIIIRQLVVKGCLYIYSIDDVKNVNATRIK